MERGVDHDYLDSESKSRLLTVVDDLELVIGRTVTASSIYYRHQHHRLYYYIGIYISQISSMWMGHRI